MATINTTADYHKDTEYFCQYNNNPSYEDGMVWKKCDCVEHGYNLVEQCVEFKKGE